MKSFSLFIVIAYVALQLISNISSIKIGFVFSYAVDMGVFLYPLTFTLRDLVHKELGKKLTQKCIYFAAGMNFAMILYFYLISFIPSDTQAQSSALFDQVMNPVWRIVIFSIIAQLVGELVDTEIYHLYVKKFQQRHKWGRVLVSNAVSIPVDNLIFCIGAFAFTYSPAVLAQIFVFNLIVKYGISALSIPLIYIGKRDEK